MYLLKRIFDLAVVLNAAWIAGYASVAFIYRWPLEPRIVWLGVIIAAGGGLHAYLEPLNEADTNEADDERQRV